jgi:hypothetical protein
VDGVPPAQLRLDAGDTAGPEIDLRLVMKDHLVAGDALAQIEDQRELVCRLPIRQR